MAICIPPRTNVELTDTDMAARLQAVPNNLAAEDAFLGDTSIVPGVAHLEADRRAVDPQEPLADYARVLAQIKRVDGSRFGLMHKGTPYYMMGWLAYASRDYESGVFYMDAALSEDYANHTKPEGTPAAAFIFLNSAHPGASANHIVVEIRAEVDAQIRRYAGLTGTKFTTDDLVARFIKPGARDLAHRSIVTALLTFTLEGKQRLLQMDIRSGHGGTLEPFLTHLFKGGLIFESILKKFYYGQQTAGGSPAASMGAYLSLPKARSHLGLAVSKALYQSLPSQFALIDVLNSLIGWRGASLNERAVAIAYGIRNTSGHDLGWPAHFDTAAYRELFEGLMDAIFWTIERKYP